MLEKPVKLVCLFIPWRYVGCFSAYLHWNSNWMLNLSTKLHMHNNSQQRPFTPLYC